MLAHGLRHGIGMTRLVKMSKVNFAFKQFMTTTEWKQVIYLPGQDCWRSMDIADVYKFESRQVLRHLSPFPEAGEVLTAISSVCASLMKSDEQLGPRRFSFSTSLPSDI